MTDRTHPEAGSTHIIRYALELGLLWVDGSGRDKVREALAALEALEAQLEAVGAARAEADSVLEDAARLLRQILAASQDGDSDTHLSAHFVSRIETITKAGGAA